MRRDMNEYQNMDVLPMATAQKVKTMIIQREMKPAPSQWEACHRASH